MLGKATGQTACAVPDSGGVGALDSRKGPHTEGRPHAGVCRHILNPRTDRARGLTTTSYHGIILINIIRLKGYYETWHQNPLQHQNHAQTVDQHTILQEWDSGNVADRVGCIAWQLARLKV